MSHLRVEQRGVKRVYSFEDSTPLLEVRLTVCPSTVWSVRRPFVESTRERLIRLDYRLASFELQELTK